MKKNKIFIGLALGIGAYLLWNLNRKKSKSSTADAVEEVKETVKKVVKPKGEEIFRGVSSSSKNLRSNNKQFVRIASTDMLLGKPKTNRPVFLQKGENFEIENSKGERKKILFYTMYGVGIDSSVSDSGKGGWLEKGEKFKLIKLS